MPGGAASFLHVPPQSSHAADVASFLEGDDDRLMKRFARMVREGATRVRQVGERRGDEYVCQSMGAKT